MMEKVYMVCDYTDSKASAIDGTRRKQVTMTEQNAQAWAHLQPRWREQRMREWAEMLEQRVKQLDPNYKAFPWGRRDAADVLDNGGQRICGTYTLPA